MKYLDASVPLCAMTGEPSNNFQKCIDIMERLEHGREIISTSVLTIAEIRHILEKREKINIDKVDRMVFSFLDCQGLKLLDMEAIICREALELASKFEIDFVDAYNVMTMSRNGIKEIYSLDEHYDMFKDIKRLIR